MSGKTLVVRFSAIGDCVMTAWAVTALREAEVGPLVWALQERCAPVVAAPGLVDEVVVADTAAWKKRRWSPATWRGQMGVFARLRRYGFETGLDFQGHSKTALCLRLSGAKRRYASRATDGFAARLNQVVECGAGSRHEVEVAMGLVGEVFGAREVSRRPVMPEVEPGVVDEVTIQTGAGWWDKVYRAERWEEVARELLDQGVKVTVVGGPGDARVEVDGAEDLVGRLNLEETVARVARSRVHVAADTGTGHIAAAYGRPVVSLFGRTDPVLYTPYGAPCTVLREEKDVNLISPRAVVEAAMNAWEGQV